MRDKNLSLISIGLLLSVGLIVGSFVINRPIMQTQTNVPVFYGEEAIVKADKAVKAFTGMKAVKVVKAEKAKVIESAVKSAPALLPLAPPSIAYQVLPQYPLSALEEGLQGTTLLSVYIGATGNPEQVNIKTTSGVALLDQAAINAVAQWKFNPATQAGAALSSWFQIPVRFEVK